MKSTIILKQNVFCSFPFIKCFKHLKHSSIVSWIRSGWDRQARAQNSLPSVPWLKLFQFAEPSVVRLLAAVLRDATSRHPWRRGGAHAPPHSAIRADSVAQDGHSLPCPLSVLIPRISVCAFFNLKNHLKVSNSFHFDDRKSETSTKAFPVSFEQLRACCFKTGFQWKWNRFRLHAALL